MLLTGLMAALALSGCTDDDGSDGDEGGDTDTETQTGAGTTTGTTTEAPPEKRDPVTWSVEVQDNSFAPGSLTIQVGDTVEWTQVGSNPHTVTEEGSGFDSHENCNSFADSVTGDCMAEGDTYEQTFDEVQVVNYICKIHGGDNGAMDGSITVEAWYNSTPTA